WNVHLLGRAHTFNDGSVGRSEGAVQQRTPVWEQDSQDSQWGGAGLKVNSQAMANKRDVCRPIGWMDCLHPKSEHLGIKSQGWG
ncbi:MAG: hypothetical protein RL688_1358, partial [Actinomycetota bacterium]